DAEGIVARQTVDDDLLDHRGLDRHGRCGAIDEDVKKERVVSVESQADVVTLAGEVGVAVDGEDDLVGNSRGGVVDGPGAAAECSSQEYVVGRIVNQVLDECVRQTKSEAGPGRAGHA